MIPPKKSIRSEPDRCRRGSALISALAMVAVTCILLSGACLLTVSYATRQRREADYARAIDLADAAINAELRYVSQHIGQTPTGHTSAAPLTGSIPGITGTFTAYSQATNGSSTWAAPQTMQVVATGTVGGITRKVTAICKGATTLFEGGYAVYGVSGVSVNGSGTTINGNLGSNGTIDAGSGVVNGQVILGGASATLVGGTIRDGITRLASPVIWPTIDSIVAQTFNGGWSYLSASAQLSSQASRIRQYANTSYVLSSTGTTSAGWNASWTDLSNNRLGTLRNSTLILPPGDYYFTSMQLSGSSKIICDTAGQTTNGVAGPVRIWVGGSSTQQDTLNIPVSFTSTDPHLFRLYYNKAADLSIAGGSSYYGAIYAVRAGSGTGTRASITISGGSNTTGALVADTIKFSGGSITTYPGSGFGIEGDYVDRYAYSDSWKEIAVGNGAVFTDGTNR